jgi:nicotinate phosphoribosyltransferase
MIISSSTSPGTGQKQFYTVRQTLLYKPELPILALVSESFFKLGDTDWNPDMDIQYAAALEKGKRLIEGGCIFSEFGTRRRRNAQVQDVVVSALKAASLKFPGPTGPGTSYFSGTSNVHLAMKYDLSPIGTVAHEWTMAVCFSTPNQTGIRNRRRPTPRKQTRPG